MSTKRTRRALGRLGLLALALGMATACETSDPMGPEPAELSPAAGTVVIEGVVDASPLNQATAPGGMASVTAPASPGGITVEVEGVGVVDTTDAEGAFRLEVPADEGTVVIHFLRGDIDATLTLQGLTPGTILGIQVQVGANKASVQDSKQGGHADFRGLASLVEVRGRAPERVLALDVHDGHGRSTRVLVEEKGTRFHPEGNLGSFGDLLRYLETDWAVRVGGEGRLTDAGIIAHWIRAEVRDHNGGDLTEFRGLSALLEVRGDAPHRTMAISVRNGDGPSLRVLVEEGATRFAQDGTVTSFEELLRAYAKDPQVKVAGEGRPTDAGIVAVHIRAEIRPDLPGGDLAEFRGLSARVEVRGEAPKRVLAIDVRHGDAPPVRVLVDEETTRFAQDGTATSFEELLRAYAKDPQVKVAGEGRPTDAGIVAVRIRAEARPDLPGGDPGHATAFEGAADFVSLRGEAPARTLRLEVTDGDRRVLVDVIEGRTVIDPAGDYPSFGRLLAAAEGDVRLQVEGEGALRDDGTIAATEIEAEVRD